MPFQSESIPTYSVCTAVLIILRVSFDHMCNYAFTSHFLCTPVWKTLKLHEEKLHEEKLHEEKLHEEHRCY